MKLPIGVDNFEKLRMEGFYYVDKTGLIEELLENWGDVNLFTRPRRFGKSLNMSMLKSFFELGCHKELFEGLKIMENAALCDSCMGRFPVISVSLKGANADTFEVAKGMLRRIISKEAYRLYSRLPAGVLTPYQEAAIQKLLDSDMDDACLMDSLYQLSILLHQCYGKKVIILIDEYDVPLAKAAERGYYEPMVVLIRNLFEQALKTNDSLHFAVLTGCLRVTKESIFTGLNNLNVLSLLDVRFDEYFGFTDREVRELLDFYDLSGHYEEIKRWYDGYRFGDAQVYCPWDVICYCDKLRFDPQAQPEEYWANTSGNAMISRFLEMAKADTRRDIEKLAAGETVAKEIRQELTYKELYDSVDNLWSVLFTTGYLTCRGKPDGRRLKLAIPNTEILRLFERQILHWFQHMARQDGDGLRAFCEAFARGDAAEAERRFGDYLRKTISIRDTAVRKNRKESFYHGVLLGLLGYKDTWAVSSNRESGDGYSDILIELEEERTGIVLEIKYAEDGNLEQACREALAQIENRRYDELFHDEGIETVLRYGVACYKKQCRIVMA